MFCSIKIGGTKTINNSTKEAGTGVSNKRSNAIGYRSVLCLHASHRFRKRKQAGNALMMNVEIASARPAVQDAPLMSNLYL